MIAQEHLPCSLVVSSRLRNVLSWQLGCLWFKPLSCEYFLPAFQQFLRDHFWSGLCRYITHPLYATSLELSLYTIIGEHTGLLHSRQGWYTTFIIFAIILSKHLSPQLCYFKVDLFYVLNWSFLIHAFSLLDLNLACLAPPCGHLPTAPLSGCFSYDSSITWWFIWVAGLSGRLAYWHYTCILSSL